jgi:CDP-glucose 4,6-dehydratase
VKIPALVAIDRDFWDGRRVLVTGHTGFKGAWLCLWLQSLGARLSGLSAGVPTVPSLYELARVGAGMQERSVDVRDATALARAIEELEPEVVLHLAAQPMVRRALSEPALTYEINVTGTVNVLEAVRGAEAAVRAVVVVTSDKCYENPPGRVRRFVESDPLGGADPYSSSKACAELLTAAYRRSYFSAPGSTQLATARAGNVIGGGDWGAERLVPDAVRAAGAGEPLRVRNPQAVRPWQHVLSPLGGYLALARALHGGEGYARAFNFGPPAEDEQTVASVVERIAELWPDGLRWELDVAEHPPEAARLALDSSLAERELDWRPACTLERALDLLVAWHVAERDGRDMRAVSLEQIASAAPG